MFWNLSRYTSCQFHFVLHIQCLVNDVRLPGFWHRFVYRWFIHCTFLSGMVDSSTDVLYSWHRRFECMCISVYFFRRRRCTWYACRALMVNSPLKPLLLFKWSLFRFLHSPLLYMLLHLLPVSALNSFLPHIITDIRSWYISLNNTSDADQILSITSRYTYMYFVQE